MTSPNCEIFSFNEIVEAPWEHLKDKKFKRIDTDEIMGTVYAKYDNKFKLSSMLNDGIIEFIDVDKNKIKIIFGIDFNKDNKLFQVITQ
jgi:hypothetical protein